MAKFLFVVPPFFGHVSPTISLGASLIEKGHQVAWTGLLSLQKELFPEKGYYFFPEKELEEHQTEIDRILKLQDEGPNLSVFEAAKLAVDETAIPFAKIMMKGVSAVIDRFQPDIVINDCLAYAGSLAAYLKGIPYATTIPVPPDVMGKADSKVMEGYINRFLNLQRSLGIEEKEPIIFSSKLCLIFTSQQFARIENPLDFAKFVGPVSGRPNDVPFDWERLSKVTTPKVYATIGTLLIDIRKAFFSRLIDAFKDKPITIIAATDPDIIEKWPDNFIVQGFVPQTELMKQVDVVICHGGFNTVNDTFFNGLPMLITPIGYDHFHTANLIEKAGCGINIKYKRMRTEHLVNAIDELLNNPKYREAAKEIQKSFFDAGGNEKAVELLEEFYRINKEPINLI
ncbi:MAG: glycosyl transferase [Candidatus Symbiothrix sp.]|jgi:MGT family glycosyltransferase|nr:glycosyl transferase [Candidatus Symbiothrix sp.]